MTFAQLKALIADDLMRSDLTTQINQAVLDAVEDEERSRFYFNERRDTPAFTTVAGQEIYTASDDADIATIVHIDSLVLIRDSVAQPPMTARTENWINERGDDVTGAPTAFSYLAKRIRLYPIPDAAYQVYMTGQIRLAALSADGDTNAWTTDAQQLIRAAAKAKLYRDVIQDFDRAERMTVEAMRQRAFLLGETTNRGGRRRLKATVF